MSTDWTTRRQDRLRDLQQMGAQGRAEFEDLDRLSRGFYPVPEHLRALDPEVVLIVGPRGAGKTEIARVLTEANLAEAVSAYAPSRVPTAGKATWKKAYPLQREGFDAKGLRSFLEKTKQVSEGMQNLWFAYLVRCLQHHLDEEAGHHLAKLLGSPGGAVHQIYKTWERTANDALLALDRLDRRLEESGEYIFISYDELDVIAGQDWDAMTRAIQGLVAFWAAYARRWRCLRAKIFLRTDLYDRFATLGGADLAKLAAGRVELSWSDRDLYAMLLKRIANASNELFAYVKRSRSPSRTRKEPARGALTTATLPVLPIRWTRDEELGHIPSLDSWQDARPVLERMIGQYMGAGKKKGYVYRWLLDHVRDGRGRALPRPLVRLLEEAARIELSAPHPLREPRLLDPGSLRRALDRVSNEHVGHALDEWPWLNVVKECFKTQLVPWEKERDILRLLEGLEKTGDSAERPPFSGRDLLDYLVEIGILRRRAHDRFDAPDLFLAGLGLRRKGGVRRR